MADRRLPRRLAQLLVGLWLYGATMALMVESGLGLNPWDVLHDGLAKQLPLSFGAVTAVVGVAVLLVWFPLRQRPGIGTVLSVIISAISVDVTLAWIPPSSDGLLAIGMLLTGITGNGLAGALYVGADLGPGPRDGVWVGIVRRTGLSVRLVRTVLEVSAVAAGYFLGGTVGAGTVLYALVIGPIVQVFLPLVRVDPRPREVRRAQAVASLPG